MGMYDTRKHTFPLTTMATEQDVQEDLDSRTCMWAWIIQRALQL